MKIRNVSVLTAVRPHYIKALSLFEAIDTYNLFSVTNIDIPQHYSKTLTKDRILLDGYDTLKIDLDFNILNSVKRVDLISKKIQDTLEIAKPDLFIVIGDVDTTLSGAIAGNKAGIPVVHVESGLRSWDLNNPEERNRVNVDSLTSIHIATEPSGVDNIYTEFGKDVPIYLCGSLTIDALCRSLKQGLKPRVITDPYLFFSLHRKENTDPRILKIIIEFINQVSMIKKVIFSIHPNTYQCIIKNKFDICENIDVIPPLNHIDCLSFMLHADAVMTDSGGIQEETSYLNIPCFTLRSSTERPITINRGTNILIPPLSISDETIDQVTTSPVIPTKERTPQNVCDEWDGNSAKRIWEVISSIV